MSALIDRWLNPENTSVEISGVEYTLDEMEKLNLADETIEGILPYMTDSSLASYLANIEAKKKRDQDLDALVHDFGDGRVMQVRQRDESNIRNAIEVMEAQGIPFIGWVMVDNVKHPVTLGELKTALSAGQLAAMQIWDTYDPAA